MFIKSGKQQKRNRTIMIAVMAVVAVVSMLAIALGPALSQ